MTENNTEDNQNGSFFQRAKKRIKTHVVDSTALLSASNPLFAGFETMAAGMTNEESINTRCLAAVLTYAGMGRLFTKGMDVSREIFKIKPETSERLKQVHDTAYAMAYNAVISPAFYLAAGVRDVKPIMIGTACSVGLSLIAGGPMGYAVDAFRDLTGIKESERLPQLVRSQNRKVKLGLAGLLMAGSIYATSLVYDINDKINLMRNPPIPAEVINAEGRK